MYIKKKIGGGTSTTNTTPLKTPGSIDLIGDIVSMKDDISDVGSDLKNIYGFGKNMFFDSFKLPCNLSKSYSNQLCKSFPNTQICSIAKNTSDGICNFSLDFPFQNVINGLKNCSLSQLENVLGVTMQKVTKSNKTLTFIKHFQIKE